MKNKKNFLIATLMSLGIGLVIAVSSCNKPSATAPILPGNEFNYHDDCYYRPIAHSAY